MAESVLVTRGLTKRYGRTLAVNDVKLNIEKGQIYGLVGRNGAGKTTLIRMVTGQTVPSGGELSLFGAAGGHELAAMRARTGVMVETPSFYPYLTARQNLEYYRIQRGIPGKECVDEALEQVRLTDTGKKKFKTFSLGMKQRLAIALAVMHDPELLILDEPINGLDPIGIAEVRDFIRALCDERGKTILISSHILSEIALLADDIGIIDHGVLLEEESLAELEQKNGKVLRFTVSNAPVAAQLLQQEMGVQAVTVENERNLTVRDLRLDTGAAVRRFVEAGLVVSDAHLYEDTLEDYFKRITGGEGIA